MVIALVPPNPDELDANGRRLFQLVVNPAVGHPTLTMADGSTDHNPMFRPASSGPDVTPQSAARFKDLMDELRVAIRRRDIEAQDLMVYMLSRLSDASKETLGTQPHYENFKLANDTYRM